MSTFTSTIIINKPVTEIYNFLADMNNHQQLMPPNISDWSSTVDTANFNIQNMAKISLRVDSRTPNYQIVIAPTQTPPFPIKLLWQLYDDGDNTKITYTITAELNMMMKMMASGPLQKLADHEIKSLAALF